MSLGAAVIGYALLLALLLLVIAVLGMPRPSVLGAALGVLELGVVGFSALDVVLLIRGQHHGEVATNLGYVIVSVALLPASAVVVRLDRGRWASVALAVGCAVVAVVTLRLHQTLGDVRG